MHAQGAGQGSAGRPLSVDLGHEVVKGAALGTRERAQSVPEFRLKRNAGAVPGDGNGPLVRTHRDRPR